MENIKEILIHWLGGYTEKEKFEGTFNIAYRMGINYGRSAERREIKEYADTLYGLPADEWSKKMYEYLTKEDEQ